MINFDSTWIKTVFFYASYFLAQTQQKIRFSAQMNEPLAYENDGANLGFSRVTRKEMSLTNIDILKIVSTGV